MTAGSIKISRGDRIATQTVIESSQTRHLQRVVIDGDGSTGGVVTSDALYRLLRIDGADDGAFEMAVDGSGTAVDFEYIVPASKTARVTRVTGFLTDVGSMTAFTFGAMTALTNGITIKALTSADVLLLDFLDGITIKDNADWSTLAGPDALSIAAAYGIIPLRWEIERTLGARPLILTAGERLQFKVQDDLTGLSEMKIMVGGVEHDA